ncbi:ATP-dependent DNA helicase, partial [Salsipaludibacter albus]|uniref:ATP-dependent DNA helicase n=1 Tax=Salsipaludibacter albus TaxID=2849650 RepID=UPI001EE3BE7C
LAANLRALAEAPGRLVDLPGAGERTVPDELTDGQRRAVATAIAHPVTVLTGGPGTGKTRTVAEIVAAAADLGADVALCAPTGRAAKRVEELVGMEASTIHRLLGARPLDAIDGGGGFVFSYGRDDPLGFDMVVVDEVSMCDTALLRSLTDAIEPGTHLVLVGDPDQLPSVGSGDVLADVVASDVVPVTHLDEIHRQAAASRIVALAREVNAGQVGPIRGVDGDVFMAEESRREVVTARVVEAVAVRAPDYFDVEVDDIQVVAPMYRGPCGVDALNAALKERLNPDTGQRSYRTLQVGDRVMVTRNDADLDVSNGDVGMVVDVGRNSLQVRLGTRVVTFDSDSVAELTHAWAITVHKSQGGQWPVVVLVADRSHRIMLRRNLLYTAISRAERALIVVGQAAALADGAQRRGDTDRTTGLAARLRAPA